MKKILSSIFWILLFKSKVMLAQSESSAQVAERLKPEKSAIVHKVIQADTWGMKGVIISFYETRYFDSTSKLNRQYVEGFLFIPNESNQYKKVLIDKFEDDNVDSNIESVFFANTDRDNEKELFVISTVTHRLQYLYEGTQYSITAYDNFNFKNIPTEMTILKIPIEGGFEGYIEQKKSVSKYKNATDVQKKLKRLGFK